MIFIKNNIIMIPKIIHQTAPKDKSRWHPIWETCQNSWKENFPEPEYSYKFWNDEDLLNLIKNDFPEYLQLYNDFGKDVILKVDFARYAILYKFGGIYADMDFMCKKNFYDQLSDNLVIVESSAVNEIVQNSLMASQSHDERWLNVLENCKNYYYKFKNDNPNTKITGKYVIDITGPRLLSRALDIETIQMLPKQFYNPYSNQFNSNNIYTKHFGTGKWGPCSGIKLFTNLRDIDNDLKKFYSSLDLNYSLSNIPEGIVLLNCGSSSFYKKNIQLSIKLSNPTFTLCNNPYKDTFKITYNASKNCVTLERTDIKSGWGYNHNIYIKSSTVLESDNANNNDNHNTTEKKSFNIDALKVYNIDKKTRIGKDVDGGYCILLQNSYDVLLSGGISHDTSFEEQFLKIYNNINCEAFEGSINSLPENSNKKINFTKKFIGFDNNDNYTNCHDIISNYNDIFLKMDIEEGEYDFFQSLTEKQIQKFKQIVLEVHYPTTIKRWELLNRLAKTHYLIHVHGNNFQKKVSIKDLENNFIKIKILPCKTNLKKIRLSVPLSNSQYFSLIDNKSIGNYEFTIDSSDKYTLIVKRTDKNSGWTESFWITISNDNIIKTNCNIDIPKIFECTYVRKTDFNFTPDLNRNPLPSELDMPNDAARPDVDLNYYPFVNN